MDWFKPELRNYYDDPSRFAHATSIVPIEIHPRIGALPYDAMVTCKAAFEQGELCSGFIEFVH